MGLTASRAVVRNGVTVAVIVSGADLARLGDQLLPDGLGRGSVVTLLDEQGMVIYRSLEPALWVGRDLSGDSLFKRLSTTRQGSVLSRKSSRPIPHCSAWT